MKVGAPVSHLQPSGKIMDADHLRRFTELVMDDRAHRSGRTVAVDGCRPPNPIAIPAATRPMPAQTRADGDGSPRTHTVTADAGGATPEHSPACAGPDLGTPGIPQLVLAVLLERGA